MAPRPDERSGEAGRLWGEPPSATRTDRVVTLPNALSTLRLAGVPLFLWLVLTERDALAIAVLMVSGTTDWLDGKIARAWNQMSRLGALLDPAADRLYILATLVGLTVRGVVPLWLTAALIGRDLVLAGFLPVLRRYGYGPLPVHFLGKAATFNLLAGFPLLLLGEGDSLVSRVAHAFGWAFAIWGTSLYLWAGVLYVVQVQRVVSSARQDETGSDVVRTGRSPL
ncbi:MAG: CDP-alcohol phosphatidyltransferase family protein [Sporichthyaceae bacterium]|nr:CDP-alcohol phosphatidyltransferase family protein [Sporichthyaceae bacterium]